MANLIIPPGYAQCAFRVSNATVGHVCVWTVGVKLAGSSWSQIQQANFFSDVSDALKPLWDSNVTQTGFHALIGNDGPPLSADVSAAVIGTSGAMITASPNVTYLLRKITGFAGRAFRGRAYLPFVNSGELDENGRLSGTVLTRFQTASVALLAAGASIAGGGVDGYYLLHRVGSAGAGEGPTLVTDFQASNVVATQRKRLER